jgi:hypothetical protein
MTKRKKDDEIPAVHLAGATFSMCIELLSELHEDEYVEPSLGGIKDLEPEESVGYAGRVEPDLIELRGEVVFPLKCLFDSEMVLFNYCKFYL